MTTTMTKTMIEINSLSTIAFLNYVSVFSCSIESFKNRSKYRSQT